MMAVVSLGYVAIAVLIGLLVDTVGNGSSEGHEGTVRRTILILICLSAVYLVREGLNVLRRMVVEGSCTRLNCDLHRRVLNHVMQFDMATLAGEKLGSLHGKIFRSVDGLIHFVRLMFLDFLPAILIGLFAIGTSVFKQPLLGTIMIGVVPIALLLTLKQLNSQKGVRLQLMRDCENIDGIVVEQLSGIEYIRVADTLDEESSRLGIALEKRRKFELHHHMSMSLYGFGKAINESAFHILLLAIASMLALKGKISVGDVITFSVLFYNVMSPVNEVHRVIDQGHESSLRVADLMALLATPTDQSFHTIATPLHTATTNNSLICLEDVQASYHHPHARRPSALKGISLDIHRGETIGIAGHSGSGKSTWVKLLVRLIHATDGEIRFDGLPLTQMTRKQLARQIAYVGQYPFVFSGTIAMNIAYGCGEVSFEQIIQASRMAHLHDDIIELLGGYEAHVSERGQNLSGGQRQRIAIARAILKQAPILILDEATSALDNITERQIQANLGLGLRRRTTILIAHRLSTLRDCDRIFLFDHGRIIETGSYAELINQGGSFASLVHSGDARPVAVTH